MRNFVLSAVALTFVALIGSPGVANAAPTSGFASGIINIEGGSCSGLKRILRKECRQLKREKRASREVPEIDAFAGLAAVAAICAALALVRERA